MDNLRGNRPSARAANEARPAVVPVPADAQEHSPQEQQPIDVWRSRMTGPNFRDIEGNEVPDEHAGQVADLCLELAAGHHADAARRVLSMNANVRVHAMGLLKAEPPRDADHQSGLALCILDAGFPISIDNDLAPAVALVVQRRDEWEEHHWTAQAEKFSDHPELYLGKGLPHFHIGVEYSMRDLNGWLSPEGIAPRVESAVCKQLQKATDGSFVIGAETYSKKEFLRLPLEEGTNAVPLDAEQLTRADDDEIAATFGINFQQENFGALLRELWRDLPVGEERSFRVGFRHHEGHVMRVFLKREPPSDKYPYGAASVQVYEPGVTRNIIHEKVLPERLPYLQFEQFDPKQVLAKTGVKILNIRVTDRKLASACAGRFVSPKHEVRVAGLSQALAIGDHDEVERLLDELAWEPYQAFSPAEIVEMEGALTWAKQTRDHRGIALFIERLSRLQLTPEQRLQIASHAMTALLDKLKAMRPEPGRALDILMGGLSGTPLFRFLQYSALPDRDASGSPMPHPLGLLLRTARELGFTKAQIDMLVNQPGQEVFARMVLAQDRRGIGWFLTELGQLSKSRSAELAAPSLLTVLRLGSANQVELFLGEISSARIAIEPIVDALKRPGPAGRTPLKALLEGGDPAVLQKLSMAIYSFARELSAKDRKALLVALEEAQGTRTLFGLNDSAAVKALKKADAKAYEAFTDAKDALRR
jgi:hypothetical protein